MGVYLKHINLNFNEKIENTTDIVNVYYYNINMITKSVFISAINREIEYYIGENAQDNFDIIDLCKPIDIWFHLHKESSCHVIANIPLDVKFNRNQISKIVTQGAVLCKQHSKMKSCQNVEICYTRLTNIGKTHVIGQVTTKDTKIIII